MSTSPASFVARIALPAAAVILAVALFTRAGPIDPPAGPVTPTGHTLTDIYNAILAGNNDACSPCQPAISGLSQERATLRITNIRGPNADESFDIYNLSRNQTRPAGGAPQPAPYRCTMDLNAASPFLHDALLRGTHFQQASIRFYNSQNALYYEVELTDVQITGIETVVLERCDATSINTEAVSIIYARVTNRDRVEGNETCYDFAVGRHCNP